MTINPQPASQAGPFVRPLQLLKELGFGQPDPTPVTTVPAFLAKFGLSGSGYADGSGPGHIGHYEIPEV